MCLFPVKHAVEYNLRLKLFIYKYRRKLIIIVRGMLFLLI